VIMVTMMIIHGDGDDNRPSQPETRQKPLLQPKQHQRKGPKQPERRKQR